MPLRGHGLGRLIWSERPVPAKSRPSGCPGRVPVLRCLSGGLQPASALSEQPLEAVVPCVFDRCERQFTLEFLGAQRVDRFAVSVQRSTGFRVDAMQIIGHFPAITSAAVAIRNRGFPDPSGAASVRGCLLGANSCAFYE